MNLITPDSGLLFWMVLIFGLLFFILAKWGFPAITGMVEKRTDHIDQSLKLAQEAQRRMEDLAREQNALLEKTRKEQAQIIKEATQTKARILEQARAETDEQAARLLDKARTEIAAEKESALRDIRKEIAVLSVGIAEKVIRKNLSSDEAQNDYIKTLVEEVTREGEAKNS